jgi:hypothetical protein
MFLVVPLGVRGQLLTIGEVVRPLIRGLRGCGFIGHAAPYFSRPFARSSRVITTRMAAEAPLWPSSFT